MLRWTFREATSTTAPALLHSGQQRAILLLSGRLRWWLPECYAAGFWAAQPLPGCATAAFPAVLQKTWGRTEGSCGCAPQRPGPASPGERDREHRPAEFRTGCTAYRF